MGCAGGVCRRGFNKVWAANTATSLERLNAGARPLFRALRASGGGDEGAGGAASAAAELRAALAHLPTACSISRTLACAAGRLAQLRRQGNVGFTHSVSATREKPR
jgi:hypothetical protein